MIATRTENNSSLSGQVEPAMLVKHIPNSIPERRDAEPRIVYYIRDDKGTVGEKDCKDRYRFDTRRRYDSQRIRARGSSRAYDNFTSS